MTQIQSALILAGVGAVLLVYLYNWWLSVRRRREIERAVAAHAGRAREAAADPLRPASAMDKLARSADPPMPVPVRRESRIEPVVADDDFETDAPVAPTELDEDALRSGLAARTELADRQGADRRDNGLARSPVAVGVDAAVAGEPIGSPLPAGARVQLARSASGRPAAAGLVLRPDPADVDTRVDYLVRLLPLEPVPAERLAELIADAPDTGRRMLVLGCPVGGQDWQTLLRQSVRYEELAFALQQVDRAGLIEQTSLERFARWVEGIAAQLSAGCTVPDTAQAHAVAAAFDTFCAEADVLIGINVVAPDVPVPAIKVRVLAESCGFRLQPGGQYALEDEAGFLLLTLSDIGGEPFGDERLRVSAVSGVTLLLDIPRTQKPARVFQQMIQIARQIAQGIGGRIVDDQRQNLSDAGVRLIAERVATLENRLVAQQMTPGSALARRVFA